MLYQLSYEATHWEQGQFIEFISSRAVKWCGGHGFESRWSPDFFRLLLSNCLNWKIYCDDHYSLSSTTAVQRRIISYNVTSFHCMGRYELNKLTSLPMCGLIAHLVEHRTGIRRGHGFESRWSPDFFRLLLSNCLNWKIYCDDHYSLSSTTAVQRWIISYKLHIISLHGKIWTQ